jgi:hypothetical protein
MTTLVTVTAANHPRTSPRPRVPWSTVLPLAVVAAYGSGFWLIVIRGAVGAIERTQAPFTTWLEESTLLLPLYVFAVLAALTLALRWLGEAPLRARAVTVALLLVALAVTLAATVVQAISAVYDYRLQTTQVTNMAAHMPDCHAQCLADQQHLGLLLQVHALGLGIPVMLVSNLALLGLVVALRGGRLDVAAQRRVTLRLPAFARAGRPRGIGIALHEQDDAQAGGRLGYPDVLLVAGLLAAASVHATVIPEHLTEWPAAGVFFILLTIAELDAALLVLVRLRSAAFLATVFVSAGPILLWLYSRTSGLPFGPEAGVPEPVGLPDVAASLLEASTLAVAFVMLRPRRRRRRHRPAQHLRALTLVGVIAVAVVGVAGGLGLFADNGGMHAGQHIHHHVVTADIDQGVGGSPVRLSEPT